MRTLSTAAVCLICTAGLAQSPKPGEPPPGPMPIQGSVITQSSRVRAFNAGPDGKLHSVYLANGSVVDLSASFGPGIDAQIHRGTRIRISGLRTVIDGQSIIVPQQITIGRQSFTAQLNPDANGQAGMPPRLLNGGPGTPPPLAGGDPAPHGPGGEVAGMRPPPPAGMPPPPPPGLRDRGVPPLPVGPNAPVPPPPPPGRSLIEPGLQPRSAPGNAPPSQPDAQQPAPVGSPQAPTPMDATQPAPAPPPPNL